MVYFYFIFFCSVLKKYPSKFIGCCLANPADDGSGIKQLEHLIVQVRLLKFSWTQKGLYNLAFSNIKFLRSRQEKYRAVRFNPNLWPSGQKVYKWEAEHHFSLYLLIFIYDQSGLKTQNVSNKQMTNEVGRLLFAKAGELGAPVGIMVMKVKDAFLY